jgi:hypothetical protein
MIWFIVLSNKKRSLKTGYFRSAEVKIFVGEKNIYTLTHYFCVGRFSYDFVQWLFLFNGEIGGRDEKDFEVSLFHCCRFGHSQDTIALFSHVAFSMNVSVLRPPVISDIHGQVFCVPKRLHFAISIDFCYIRILLQGIPKPTVLAYLLIQRGVLMNTSFSSGI